MSYAELWCTLPSAYHITRIENLPAIWDAGFLLSDDLVATLAETPESFAYEDIKARRRATFVTAGPGGFLSSYVPFYFTNRSPMLSTVYYRDLEYGTREQDRIVHLRVNVDRIAGDDKAFAFSDGHGIMAVTKFFQDLIELERVDWEVVRGNYWKDTIGQPDRKRRKQAEFLVHKSLPVGYIEEIGVKTAQARGELSTRMAFRPGLPPINLRPEWYYV